MQAQRTDNFLGVELGSTRIKAVQIDGSYRQTGVGAYTWESSFHNGIWSYDLAEAFLGVRTALAALPDREQIGAVGVSAMMHGYLAFDRDWQLLTPFRTWQNTITAQAAAELTEEFHFNIPQRWSIAHLYQAVRNGEAHLTKLAHITTLAGYVHFRLTGENVLGIGDASGMFPIDSDTLDYDAALLDRFDRLSAVQKQPWRIRELLPRVLCAGEAAGSLTQAGSALLDGLLPAGIPFCPPEGDAGTGMTATNAVAPRTGNVSAGTSIFAMVVLQRPLSRVYPEIDGVTTPCGSPVAMVHCNNCTTDLNAWAEVFSQTAALFGETPDRGELYKKLYELSLTGAADCGGVLVCNYLSGEGVTHFDEGRPLLVREQGAELSLANLLRASLYSALATLHLGMKLLNSEQVTIDSLMGHGGFFKTPLVGQSYLAAACNAPVTCMASAGEGGAYGAALLAAYAVKRGCGESLAAFLSERVYRDALCSTIPPDPATVEGFNSYMERFTRLLNVERAAILHT